MRCLERYFKETETSPVALADEVGISRVHMYRILTGERGMSLELLDKLHRATRIPYELLVRESLTHERPARAD